MLPRVLRGGEHPSVSRGSVSGRWAWGAEDLEAVSLCDRDQPCDVGVAFQGRRQHAFGGRLADLPQEPFELHRREADQRSCAAGFGVEGVRHALGAERERTGLSGRCRVSATQTFSFPRARRTTRPLRDARATASRARRHDDLEQAVLPAVSSLPILIVWSMPSSQNASPSL